MSGIVGNVKDGLGIVVGELDPREMYNDAKVLVNNTDHTKMFTGVSFACLILLIVSMGSNTIVRGEDVCNATEFYVTLQGRDVCGILGEGNLFSDKKYSFGFWKIDFGGDVEGSVCDNWPLPREPADVSTVTTPVPEGTMVEEYTDPCPAVKLSRTLILAATGIMFLSCLAGVLFLIGGNTGPMVDMTPDQKNEAKKYYHAIVISQLLASTVAGVGYCIWEAGPHELLEAELKESIAAQVGSLEGGQLGRVHTTLGYTYGMMLWAFLWPFAVVGVKVLLPFLSFENEDKREARKGHGFTSAASTQARQQRMQQQSRV